MLTQVLRQFARSISSRRGTVPTLNSIALSGAFCSSAFGANTLNVPGQYATIQAAITAAAVGDTVLVADGTYTGVGNVNLDFGGKDITVTSVNGAAKTIIDCQGSAANTARGFYFHSGETIAAKVDGLTIENGYANDGAGIDVNIYNPTITNCIFIRNISTHAGGAIRLGIGNVLIENCSFTSNTNSGYLGGAIYSTSFNAVINRCKFSGNSATSASGGAIASYGGLLAITNSVFISNSSNGTVTTGGGAVYTSNGGVSLSNCVLTNNTAVNGGGIWVDFSVCAATNCLFNANSAIYGGAIDFNVPDFGTASRTINCTFTGNSATTHGGGIYNVNSNPPVVTNCIFYGDTTGGEIYTNTVTGGVAPNVTFSEVQGGITGAGNIDADPLFLNGAAGDFHLQPTSPCHANGTTNGAPTIDIDGNPRPNPPSMGAYEVSATGPSPAITSFAPTFGPVGATVTILGTGFTGTTSVKIGTVLVQTYSVLSDSQITATIPQGANTGKLFVVTSGATAASAAFFAVTNALTLNVPSQFGTIQSAIDTAIPGDTVLVADGTYTGSGNVNLDFHGKSITVMSANGASKTIIDCADVSGNGTRAFYFHSNETAAAKVIGFTTERGYAYGPAIYGFECSPTIMNCNFSHNIGNDSGGAIDIWYSNSVISHCVFSNNTAGSHGAGAIYAQNGNPVIDSCVFTNNSITSLDGGAIDCNGGNLVMSNCQFSGNSGAYNGGAVVVLQGRLKATNCLFSNNSSMFGGGIFVSGGPATIINCTFSGNSATRGGGICTSGSSGTITNCTLYGNSGLTDGGGIYATSGNMIITNCILSGDNSPHEIAFNPNYAGPMTTYSDIQGGYIGTGNINADPLFVNSATGDLHLQASSPCAGTGTSSGAPATDADGNPRPNPPSMGAYDLLPPSAPTLSGTPGNATVTLTWTASTGATSYNVKRGTVNGGPYISVSSPVTTSYTNTGLTNGVTYNYVVSAVNAGGESSNSNQVTATPVAPNSAPTVAVAASATPNPVTGTTVALSVLGADDGGEANLTYTWSLAPPPPAYVGALSNPVSLISPRQTGVIFSINGTNAAKNTVVTLPGTGAYGFKATITDAFGLSATSGVTVTVNQALTTISITPGPVSINTGTTQQFAATAKDQFGNLMVPQPVFSWTVAGGGTINLTGLFTAGSVAGGPFDVHAANGSVSGAAAVTVVAVANPVIDFNGDGKPDLILQNTPSNKVALWYMNNAAVAGGAYVSTTPPAGWKVVASGDFNGDGKPDTAMQNTTTNQIALWYLNGASLTAGAYLGTTPTAGWNVVGSGDFNGNGKRDLVLQNTASNKVAIWYLNGTTVTGAVYLSATPPAGWHVVACGDFNGDGKQDVVLQNTNTRQVALWYLNGATLTGGGYVSIIPGAGWSVVGSGDFNGDGKRDLVLQNSSTNQTALWYLNGLTLTSGAYTSVTPGAGWKVVGPR